MPESIFASGLCPGPAPLPATITDKIQNFGLRLRASAP